MPRKVKIWFTDWGKVPNARTDFFVSVLSKEYEVIIDRTRPDYVFCSCWGQECLNYDCVRIFYTGENLVPDFNLFDYAIGFHYLSLGDRYVRFPYYATSPDQIRLLVRDKCLPAGRSEEKTRFCNYIYSNTQAVDPIRGHFFEKLSRYKRIDSPGRHFNNTEAVLSDPYEGDWTSSKLAFQRTCKFSIAFENSSVPGYTTEKLMHAFLANTIPIYWGNPLVGLEFNTRAFINCHDYDSLEKVIDRVIDIDNNDCLYMEMLNTLPFVDNRIPFHLEEEYLLAFLRAIMSQPLAAASRRAKYGRASLYAGEVRKAAEMRTKASISARFHRLFQWAERLRKW